MTRRKIPEATPLRVVVGTRVREMREAAGKTKEDLALGARWHGLSWSRTKVGSLESGEKAISAEELVLLPHVLAHALGREVLLAELFDADAVIPLTKVASVASRDVPALLADQRPDPDDVFPKSMIDLTGPHIDARTAEVQQDEDARERATELRLRPIKVGQRDEMLRSAGPAEQRVAAQLGEPPGVLRLVYAHLWGQTFTAQRDAAVQELAKRDASPASLQALRGQVTRRLIREVETFIASREKKG